MWHSALDGMLQSAEKGAGAAAPGFFGEDDGRGGCTGSATVGVWAQRRLCSVDLLVGPRSGVSGRLERSAGEVGWGTGSGCA